MLFGIHSGRVRRLVAALDRELAEPGREDAAVEAPGRLTAREMRGLERHFHRRGFSVVLDEAGHGGTVVRVGRTQSGEVPRTIRLGDRDGPLAG